jgi:hypothetical protein
MLFFFNSKHRKAFFFKLVAYRRNVRAEGSSQHWHERPHSQRRYDDGLRAGSLFHFLFLLKVHFGWVVCVGFSIQGCVVVS